MVSEWPAGRADQVIRMPDSSYIAVLTSAGRIQRYDADWRFLNGWWVDAGGGVFKARLEPSADIEVWTARGQKRFVFRPTGEIAEQGSYVPRNYTAFPADGSAGFVRTPIPLLIFTHPFYAWGVGASGMALLIWSDPGRFRKKKHPTRRYRQPR